MINEQDLVKALSVPAHILHRHTPVIGVTWDVITVVIPAITVVVAHTIAWLGEGEGGPTRAAGSIKTITSTVCMLWDAAIFSTAMLQCLITATLTIVSTVLSTLYLIRITTIIAQQPWYAGQEEGG